MEVSPVSRMCNRTVHFGLGGMMENWRKEKNNNINSLALLVVPM
jgi:hypothetical protein